MRILLAIYLIMISVTGLLAQSPQVPSRIKFADQILHLNEQVRKEIQVDVDNLTRSPKYFNIKLERVKQYFPIIERILREENVPDDFKFLVIQESALISDAVSTANAIGFWQFKEASGKEVGLRIDSRVDERLNIVSSTHGACKYLKTNNFYFKNWMYSLLAYNTGRGGAESHIDKRDFGSKRMDLNRRTHWYVKKFLAHKIAFENALDKGSDPSLKLFEYKDGGGKSLNEIARELNVDGDLLSLYNKWLKRGEVPTDKVYTVIIPGVEAPKVIARKERNRKSHDQIRITANKEIKKKEYSPNRNLYPEIEEKNSQSRIVSVNGIPGVIARESDDLEKLARLGELNLKKFMKFNDINISHDIKPGQVYYFKRKRNKANEYYHVVFPGENIWSVSQKYGIKKRKLLRKNRFRKDEVTLKPGIVLWLRHIRPEDYPVEYGEYPKEEPVLARKTKETRLENHPEQEKSEKAVNIVNKNTETVNRSGDGESEIVEEEVEDPDALYENAVMEKEEIPKPLFHLVEAGETLYSISRKYNIELDRLFEINEIDEEATIQVGEKIYLRDPFPEARSIPPDEKNIKKTSNSYITHSVARGETLYSISRLYGVTLENLMEWNGKTDYSIKEGETLKILESGN